MVKSQNNKIILALVQRKT
uniref:Uncharacterized protein n=1 Tax=Arundo donax TaxID=35708 RepID=A0A0A9Q069_ARUDO